MPYHYHVVEVKESASLPITIQILLKKNRQRLTGGSQQIWGPPRQSAAARKILNLLQAKSLQAIYLDTTSSL